MQNIDVLHPQPYHHGDLRAALISAGRAILEESGPGMLTLRGAARRAGVSHGAPAHHFGSLAAFLGDCAADGFAQFTCLLQQARSDGRNPAASLKNMGRAYLGFAYSHRAMFRLMFDRDSFGKRTDLLELHGNRAYDELVQATRALKPNVSAKELAFRVASFWAIVHGYAGLVLEDKLDDPAWPNGQGRMMVLTLQTFIQGLQG